MLALALTGPGLAGQTTDETDSTGGVGGWISAHAELSELSGQGALLLGGRGGLALGSNLRIGGGGYSLVGEVDLDVGSAAAAELEMGFGGVTVELSPAPGERWRAAVGLLLGGGTARARDRIAGVDLGSDNFIVIQPELSIEVRLFSRLALSAAGGYRFVSGVQDLPGVTPTDFRSVFGSLRLTVGSLK